MCIRDSICGAIGLGIAGLMARYVLKQSEGSSRIREISAAIREGALAFIGREYRILTIFVTIVAVVLGVVPMLGWWVSLVFALGAVASAMAGYIGMNIAIRSNSRTAAAAQKSLNDGLRVSFRGGAVMGMSVVGIGIIGLSVLYFAFGNNPDLFLKIIPAFGFGASSVAIFARIGGGIFTKAADTGADIVGKVEQGIPEDDPRNAAVIADFVGDNVGDVAGMGADLFESYVDSIIATMALATVAVFSTHVMTDTASAWFLPMMVAAGGIIASIIGIFAVRISDKVEAKMGALLNALRRGTVVASILTAVFSWLAILLLNRYAGANISMNVFWAILSGLIAGVLIGESTNFFTSYEYNPTKQIADSAQTGPGTLLTRGFANGLMSTLPPIILVVVAMLIAYKFSGIYGIAIAGVGMLSTLGIQDATDAYGPVADNAGGIVEMSDLPEEVRERTDALDSLGNTTAATGKGFAIGAAGLTALALLLAYTQATGIEFSQISLLDPRVIAGILLGGMIPAIFCAMTLNAVGKSSFSIVNEVRRQFREIKGLMEGTAKPDYGRCVDICARDSIRQMIAPGVMTIVVPIAVGLILGPIALGGFLIGAVSCGFILAVTFSNAGGSWDNAKKLIETGAFGGKGSDSHKAAVVGDTVGDPMKDTSGPSLNIMIKLMSIVSLLLAPVLMHFNGVL